MNHQEEINKLRENTNPTYRITVKSMEEILYEKQKVLDHGFIRVIDYMGDDSSIVQAARVSYGTGTKQINKDQGLINYLMRHRHSTPFEMCDIKLHVKLPIFVARQWIRHRTASVNEYSARYSILGKEFYIPEKQHLSPQSTLNAQGRSDKNLSEEESNGILEILKRESLRSYQYYEEMMNTDFNEKILDHAKQGISRELARMNLSLNYYTEWYWKTNLHNLLNFVGLRADSHAQYEIRAYADILMDIIKKWVPYTAEAFTNYRLEAASLSKQGIKVIQKMIKGEKITLENSDLTKREWDELMNILNKK